MNSGVWMRGSALLTCLVLAQSGGCSDEEAAVGPAAVDGGSDASAEAEASLPDASADTRNPDTGGDGGARCEGATCDAGLDAATVCGNGIVEAGELCDTGVTSGAGQCPTPASCADGDSCTIDNVANGGTCQARCDLSQRAVADLQNKDQCCPPGATSATDADCKPECGNGRIDPNESCDPAIATGQPGACSVTCQGSLGCTRVTLSTADPCNPRCVTTQITEPSISRSDQCCPPGAHVALDVDCVPVCGDAYREGTEECDSVAACDPQTCTFVPTAYRLTELVLADPPLYFGCTDISTYANGLIADMVNGDTGQTGGLPNDGILDLSYVFTFRPFDQHATTATRGEFMRAGCAVPAPSDQCRRINGVEPSLFTYTVASAGECLAPLPGTTSTRTAAPPSAVSAGDFGCFLTNGGQTVQLDIGSISVPLKNGRAAGRFNADPAAEVVEGLMTGFVTEDVARQVLVLAGSDGGEIRLSQLLSGSSEHHCDEADVVLNDKDVGPDGNDGWWLYWTFKAKRVEWR